MKKVLSIILAVMFVLISNPILANEGDAKVIRIKYDYSAQDMLDSSSAKISSISKSNLKDKKFQFQSLYRRDQASIEFIEDDYSFIFPIAEDQHIYFKKNKFRSAFFHLVNPKIWLPWNKIKVQIEQLFNELNSNTNLITKNEKSLTLCCPVKLENLFSLNTQKWHSENLVIHAIVQRSTLPQSVLPRDEDLFRMTIYVTSKINPIYIKGEV